MTGKWAWVGDDIRALARSRGRVISIDTEGTGLAFPDSTRGIAIAWRNGDGRSMHSSYLVAPDGQVSMDLALLAQGEVEIGSILRDVLARHQVVFHNEPFDHRALFRVSEAWPKDTHDTMHLARLVGWQEELSLRWLYSKYIDKPLPAGYSDMKKHRAKIVDLPLAVVAPYARTDAENTLELFEYLYPLVYGKAVDESYYDQDREYARLIMRLIRRGLKVNEGWCKKKRVAFRARMTEIEKDLRDLGLRDIGSNPAVATFLFKVLKLPDAYIIRTSTLSNTWADGVPSVSERVIDGLSDQHPVVSLIQEWRQLRGALSKWVDEYKYHASVDGRVHSLLNPFGTVSARIAATQPNITAIAMEDRGTAFGSMQGIFTADAPGSVLYSVDYSQAEARLAAVMAKEYRLIGLFNSRKDPYRQMAIDLWNDPSRRSRAKHATLAAIYGVGPDKFADTYRVDFDEAVATLQQFRRAFPRIQSAAGLAEAVARREGAIWTWNGRPRWFGGIDDEHKAFNQKVQMTVAEIVKHAMLAVEHTFSGWLRLQIHDSLIIEIPKRWESKSAGHWATEVGGIMQDAVPPMYREVVDFPTKSGRWQ